MSLSHCANHTLYMASTCGVINPSINIILNKASQNLWHHSSKIE